MNKRPGGIVELDGFTAQDIMGLANGIALYMLLSRGNRKAPLLYRMMWVKELELIAAQEIALYGREDIPRGRPYFLKCGTTEIRTGQKLRLLRWWQAMLFRWTRPGMVSVLMVAPPGSPGVEHLKFHPHPRPAPTLS